MEKQIIRLTESDLHNIVKESVSQVLTELDWKTYMNAARKWADTLKNNPAHPKRKSNIMGHENSKGDHDIPTDNRLRAFKDAARDAFDKKYGFNPYGRDRDKGSYQMSFDTDNIGSKGYYDEIGTETHVPSDKAVVGKTKDGKRTQSILRDRFSMDSFDGKDKYPRDRHEARIGFDRDYSPRKAVEPDMDRWDYMQARNKGNQEILDYANGDYDYDNGQWNLNRGGFSIFADDDENAPENAYRPGYCYADGQLEKDLGTDLIKLDPRAEGKLSDDEGFGVKPGKYKCNYNGKPCTLYVGFSKGGPKGIPTGLVCYDNDEESKKYIAQQINTRSLRV
jgi:hypothetical protein